MKRALATSIVAVLVTTYKSVVALQNDKQIVFVLWACAAVASITVFYLVDRVRRGLFV